MKNLYFILILLFTFCHCSKKSDRVNNLSIVEVPESQFQLFIRVFKNEGILELWIKEKSKFEIYKSYPICKKSGELGPKRKEGDKQVPEGVYRIDRFNPNSSYHLSLGLNYPNKSDLLRGDQSSPGSDIFIHGKCVTIGCIPLTDKIIDEVYYISELAKKRGQESIYVHIFPGIMDSIEFEKVMINSDWAAFWNELMPIYLYFENKKEIPYVLIDSSGKYSVKE